MSKGIASVPDVFTQFKSSLTEYLETVNKNAIVTGGRTT